MKDFWKLLEERSNEETLQNAAFTVDAKELKSALARLTPAYRLDRKLPILNCVKLIFDDAAQALTLTLTNLDITIQTTIPATGRKPACFCLLYAKVKMFAGFVRASKVGFYYSEGDKMPWQIKAGTANMRLPMFPISDYPETRPGGHEVAVASISDAAQFACDLEKVARFVSVDDSRRVLGGVLAEYQEGRLHLAATDGKRLFCAKSAACTMPFPGFILSLKAAAAAAKLCSKSKAAWVCQVNEKTVTIHSEETRILAKTIEGQYPNYRQVLPVSYTNEIELSAFVLKWGVDCISGGARGCHIEFEVKPGALHLIHRDLDGGFELETEIPAETDKAEPGSKIGFNGGFLADAVAAGEALKMRWNDNLNPVTILNDGYTYVIMPVRNR